MTQPLLIRNELATSVLAYAEVLEYLQGLPDAPGPGLSVLPDVPNPRALWDAAAAVAPASRTGPDRRHRYADRGHGNRARPDARHDRHGLPARARPEAAALAAPSVSEAPSQ